MPDPAPDAERLRLDLALVSVGLAPFDYDLRTRDLRADERLATLLGCPPSTSSAALERRLTDLVGPEDLDRLRSAVADAVGGVGTFHVELRLRDGAGAPAWLSVHGRVLLQGGEPRRLVGVAHDSSRDHVLGVASALESLPAAYYALDHDGVLRTLNAEAERLAGRPRDELLGHPWGDVFPLAAGSEADRVLQGVERTGRAETIELLHPEPLSLWCELRAWPDGQGTSVLLLPTAARRAAEEAAERATTQVQVLAAVGAHLSGTLDAETAVARLAGVLVPVLGDWCIVSVVDEHGALRDVGCQHADPARQDLLESYRAHRMRALVAKNPGGPPYVLQAVRTGRPVTLPVPAVDAISDVLDPGQALDAVRALAPESVVVLPLRARGRTVGIVTLARDHGRRPFGAQDLATVSGVGERAALALDNARLYGQQQKIAEGLQRDLLTPPAQSPHWETAVRYLPAAQAAQVGGDWYDAFHQPDGSTTLVIGDVVGHDIGAAAAMGQLRNLLRGISFAAPDGPAGLLGRLDAAMAGLGLTTMATALVGRLEPRPDGVLLAFSSAGHPAPVLLRAAGTAAPLAPAHDPDLLLGIDPATARHDGGLLLHEGDTLLFHTDGLVERRDQSLDVGTARLLEAVARHARRGLEDLCDALLDDLLPQQPEDDVALVAVRVRGAVRP
ncbi:SpoIIE family protein phosphatase [Kineococcus rhizosphaerae]|uniref:Serine phosphatase RsbU (Regulator of sigma subunit) n=1 Tax=Kineococcus rhizosphaerae TaxID=559628 RepID=A0A2T0QYL6_9ACTN|nr:SpoIIE family protein phosphatase [Kineococcus rhizosphaerae]PRY11474.1 serine phosphatase RsbU (regulator of sigma subunit) [Kineococcus rhizosphaerae]